MARSSSSSSRPSDASSSSLEEGLVFYGSYHNNKWNQLVHLVFVPALWWTGVVFLALIGPVAEMPAPLAAVLPDAVELDPGFITFVAYALYYLSLDFFAALPYDVLLFCMYLGAKNFIATNPSAGSTALMIHILSWILQVAVGHSHFEGRAPALLDGLFQSTVLAPLFVWFEVLFFFGFRASVYERTQKRILKNIAEFKKTQKAKQ